jgi:HK97 family phage major capsid protein
VPYNSLTSRSDVAPLIPEEVSTIMLGKATEQSAVLSQFRRIPVGGNQVRFPILSALPMAYFVSGDTGLKQTTEVGWTNKYLNIEEIATILPIPDNVIDDVQGRNVWDEAMPLITEAFARVLDQAVYFGTNAPSSWPTNVITAAAAAGNSVNVGTSNAAAGGFLGDIDALYGKLEADGYEADGFLAAIAARPLLRSARDTTGQRLDPGRVGGDLRSIDGYPIAYPMRGLWPASGGVGVDGVAMIGGAWMENFVVGVRKDITMKVLTESVITDNSGAIIYNLAQQDMTAVRLVFRVGWQVKNTINNDQPIEANRYPAAYLKTVGA